VLRPLDLGYGGGQQSHGPDEEQPRRGIYLLDEPEAALSPARQIAFLRLLWQMEQTGNAHFLIATHSPILLAYPGATIYSLDYSPLQSVEYEDTEHYRLTRNFLNNRARFFRHLFEG
jgi:predicted ATPase